ncbi:BolA family transcriptional regulator [Rhodoblastus acidophilus]|uniref:BolA family transcriptional regulator n=1 Tax=Candidatus Rhodoblastus alkanivorans TaxID=2954117 RepID=A0ABS9Z1Q1_9HYPH|nr:BolA family protein [Candidatus Rhodoblastus alkanivorans]MCI4678116.1 BolA family transcriptional regulator [Candidatus Rhodoblastus alkanivorans]MCI4681543.1 BolA family transcriptional regulator [Candidatus Rhodoblastus alkanivorans]MDI4642591.1 BolA family transcriptional regulator [Rhodoblastus acidophilus]
MEPLNKPTVRERMETKLSAAFAPEFLKVVDESHQHAGHAGHAGGAGHGGETHFRIRMISSQFAGRSRIDRHRAVNDLLAEEIAGGVHALALDVKAPGE